MEASGLGFGTARTRLDSRGFRQRDSGSLCVAGKRSDLRAVVPWEWCQAHVQSGEIVWDPNVGTRANSTLISDGIILAPRRPSAGAHGVAHRVVKQAGFMFSSPRWRQ